MKWLVFYFLAGICFVYAETSGEAVDLSYFCVSPETTQENVAPILLLHGMMNDRNTWKGIYEVLAMQTSRKVCMSDARNHGLSPRTEELNFDLLAADTVRLLDKLNISKAILLGHSMGGKTAALTALKYPNRVEKLLVEDMRPNSVASGAHFRLVFTFSMLKQSLDSVPEGANEEQAKEAVKKFLENAFKIFSPDLDERTIASVESMVCNGSKCRFLLDLDLALKMIEDTGVQEVYDGRYEGEALFIYGKSSDFKVWEAEDEIKKLFPKAELVGIEGAGHQVHEEKPRDFLSAAIGFINGNGKAIY